MQKLLFSLTRRNGRCFSFILMTLLFTSCMTMAHKRELQESMEQIEQQTYRLRERINAQIKQIENTTRTALTSQNDLQNFQSQLQDAAGEIDTLKMRLQKLEKTNSEITAHYAESNLAHTQNITKLQRQVARLELNKQPETEHTAAGNTQKTPLKVKSAKDVTKLLKSDYEKGNFRDVVQKSTQIMTMPQVTAEMIEIALEFRAESKFQLEDYRGAAIDLSDFIEQYPHAQKHARALLLLGDTYVYLKNNPVAASYYRDCVSSYPNSSEGKACLARSENL